MGHAMLLQLVLQGNPIGDAGAEVLCRVVASGNCLLQLLDLSNCGITERLSASLKGLLEGARWVRVHACVCVCDSRCSLISTSVAFLHFKQRVPYYGGHCVGVC
jgi:hypothetical protein